LATTKGSLYKYADSKMKNMATFTELANPSKSIMDIAVGENQDIFLSTGVGNILSYSASTKKKEYLIAPFNNYPETLKLLTDQYNRLWIGTETKGLFLYDINSKKLIQDSFFTGNTY